MNSVPQPSGKWVPPPKADVIKESLAPLPAKPTLLDVMRGRLNTPRYGMKFAVAQHVSQSAAQALRAGLDEEAVLACLLHDIGMGVARPDHGWWGAQLIEPYVSEKVAWAVRYHQALRFFPDRSVGYEYPELYVGLFGPDYQPPEYIQREAEEARKHRWYMTSRLVTINDIYSFDPAATVALDEFEDVIGRNFRQPAEGLGFDGSPVAHMWRTMIWPHNFL
jgi:hypothetical protein